MTTHAKVCRHLSLFMRGTRCGRQWLLLGLMLGAAVAGAAEIGSVVAATSAVATPTRSSVPEYNTKAGYLLLFTRYVQWPADIFPAADTPVVIGVLGANPFGDVLESTVRGLKSNGRLIEVRHVKTAAEATRCQLVFIARKQERDEAVWLQALRGKPVLTVIESEHGIERGAILSLLLEETARGTRVAFQANLPAAREAGLQISALMLASAKKVIREPAPQKEQP